MSKDPQSGEARVPEIPEWQVALTNAIRHAVSAGKAVWDPVASWHASAAAAKAEQDAVAAISSAISQAEERGRREEREACAVLVQSIVAKTPAEQEAFNVATRVIRARAETKKGGT